MDDLAVARDQRCDAGQLPFVDQGVHLGVQRGQAAFRQAGHKRFAFGHGGLVVRGHAGVPFRPLAATVLPENPPPGQIELP